MEKHTFVGKNYEDAVNKAKLELQELEDNLIINVVDEKKTLLSKKCEIEDLFRNVKTMRDTAIVVPKIIE